VRLETWLAAAQAEDGEMRDAACRRDALQAANDVWRGALGQEVGGAS
jgi:hypothetical protein